MNLSCLNTIADYESEMIKTLSKGLSAYIQSTAGRGNAHKANLSSYGKYQIVSEEPKIGDISTETKILNRVISAPIMIAPTAWHKMFCSDGEVATAKAAEIFNSICAISSYSTMGFSELSKYSSNLYYQLLMYKDLDLMKKYIDMAIQAGCPGIILTIDAVSGCSMCSSDKDIGMVDFPIDSLPLLPQKSSLSFENQDEYYEKYMPFECCWQSIAEIIQYSSVPVILKGVVNSQGVEKAISSKATAVVVSNHGGRQDDNSPSTLEILASIPEDLFSQIEVFLDGGVRSGGDVFKAIALGAKGVFIGRPALYGLSVGGSEGLLDVLNILKQELMAAMLKSGCTSIQEIISCKVKRG